MRACNLPAANLYNKAVEPATHWSVILRAQGSGPQARAALGELIGRYERTVLAQIRRKHPPDQTPEDLKQEFFTRVLARNDVARLDRARGPFRGWLHTAVTRFLLNAWDRWHSETAGNKVTEPLVAESADPENPEHLYLAAFSWDTLLCALGRLREKERDKQRFDALSRFLPGPQVDIVALAPVAASLGMTRTALAAAICHLRVRLRDVLSLTVAETLDLDPSASGAAEEIARETALVYRVLREMPPPFAP